MFYQDKSHAVDTMPSTLYEGWGYSVKCYPTYFQREAMHSEQNQDKSIWHEFKTKFSNENLLIARALKKLLPPKSTGVIIDVGAGLGDIAEKAFPDRSAILLDPINFSKSKNPLHKRIKKDFFDFIPQKPTKIDALLFIHSLQYIDDNITHLNSHISLLNPDHIIIAINDETTMQSDIEKWFYKNHIKPNTERKIENFPETKYKLIKEIKILGELSCPTFIKLSAILGQLIYDAHMDNSELDKFSSWLEQYLKKPLVLIPQTVELYTRGNNA